MGEFHFSPNYSMLHAYDLAFNQEMDANLRKRAMERLLEFDTVKRDRLLKTMYQYQMSNGKENQLLDVWPWSRAFPQGVTRKEGFILFPFPT